MRTKTAFVMAAVLIGAAVAATRPAVAEIDRDTIVGMWLFEENEGDTVEDMSDGGHDGVLEKGPEWAAGKYGTGLDFLGGGYVDLQDSAPDLAFGGAVHHHGVGEPAGGWHRDWEVQRRRHRRLHPPRDRERRRHVPP
jgi:hypothetical protein